MYVVDGVVLGDVALQTQDANAAVALDLIGAWLPGNMLVASLDREFLAGVREVPDLDLKPEHVLNKHLLLLILDLLPDAVAVQQLPADIQIQTVLK